MKEERGLILFRALGNKVTMSPNFGLETQGGGTGGGKSDALWYEEYPEERHKCRVSNIGKGSSAGGKKRGTYRQRKEKRGCGMGRKIIGRGIAGERKNGKHKQFLYSVQGGVYPSVPGGRSLSLGKVKWNEKPNNARPKETEEGGKI